ncbi:MAG TPA: sugar ABC transporter ATP-binding protein [Firmicutes bacterium]|nr:MAG: D-ribose transporter ATP-binding protein [Peptococcaceae bacterium 1109]HHT73735.1 sugar ABC transporter ATP-binding protein [Bacillota bacterium]
MLENVSKAFPGVQALDSVSMEIHKGEIHCLVGENGAGKSTLIKLLTGVHGWDSGTIMFNGQPLSDITPQKALHELGIVPIYQELNLIPKLDVAENIFLGREILANERFRFINRKEMIARTKEILARLGQDISPTALVGTLGIGKQQMVEIAKALAVEANLLILDEPTAPLGQEEADELFSVMRQLKSEGVTIIFISHKLEEIKEIGDRLTVLRDGKKIITTDVDSLSIDEIITYMVGRQIDDKYPKVKSKRGELALEVRNLSTPELLQDISFKAYRGEVLGIAGLVGAGRTELARAIIGADPLLQGEILINGRKVEIRSPKDAVRHGLVLLTEDRKSQGLVLNNTVLFNATLANLQKYLSGVLLDLSAQKEDAVRVVKDLSIKTPSLNTLVAQLSGGNQQKVVIGKWLNTKADIFIFDEPTRGIDVGAKTEVYNIINNLVKNGAAVIMISSELPEILGMSDRIIVLSEGRLTGEFAREEATQEKIMAAATGGIHYAS